VRALICGGRNFGRLPQKINEHGCWVVDRDSPHWDLRWAEYMFGKYVLHELLCDTPTGTEANDTWMPPRDLFIIHGGATGADKIADEWSVVNWVPQQEYRADWEKWGKRAGPIRNQVMLNVGKPDLVIAFPGGDGTANMVRIARNRGVCTIEVPYPDDIRLSRCYARK